MPRTLEASHLVAIPLHANHVVDHKCGQQNLGHGCLLGDATKSAIPTAVYDNELA